MIYISEKIEKLECWVSAIIYEFLTEKEFDSNFIEMIEDEMAVEKNFSEKDVVIFLSRESLISAMLTKDNCRKTKVILLSSSIEGSENNQIGCSGIIFIKKEENYLEKILIAIGRGR